MAIEPISASSAFAGGAGQGLGGILGSSNSSKSSQPFNQQYGLGLYGSLFFPELAQVFASSKPQEFQQEFGRPGQKLKKSKGKVGNALGLGQSGFAEDPNSPLGIAGSIGQYRRFVNQYRPYEYLAANPFGRPGGPSQAEQDLINNSLFGLTPQLDQKGARAAAEALPALLQNLGLGSLGSNVEQVLKALGTNLIRPVMPTAPMVNPISSLIGLFGGR